jgi:hypothetical protein
MTRVCKLAEAAIKALLAEARGEVYKAALSSEFHVECWDNWYPGDET